MRVSCLLFCVRKLSLNEIIPFVYGMLHMQLVATSVMVVDVHCFHSLLTPLSLLLVYEEGLMVLKIRDVLEIDHAGRETDVKKRGRGEVYMWRSITVAVCRGQSDIRSMGTYPFPSLALKMLQGHSLKAGEHCINRYS